MKKLTLILVLLLFSFGCSESRPGNKITLAKINNYEISKEEFEEEFKKSSFGLSDTLEARKEFLENLVNQKLILQEAQRQGLDKEEGFLKLIERFWEQSLLKVALEKKAKEVTHSIHMDDRVIEEAYRKMLEEGKTDKPYSQMKWELMKSRESELMNDWVAGLRNEADIEIDYGSLK